MQELDEAVLRRLAKRIYVPLPDANARGALFASLLTGCVHALGRSDLARLTELTEGFSGSDIAALAREAAMEPLREHSPAELATLKATRLRPARSHAVPPVLLTRPRCGPPACPRRVD